LKEKFGEKWGGHWQEREIIPARRHPLGIEKGSGRCSTWLKETGMKRRLIFPRTTVMQKTKASNVTFRSCHLDWMV